MKSRYEYGKDEYSDEMERFEQITFKSSNQIFSSQDDGGDPRAGHEGGPQQPGEGCCGRDRRPAPEQPGEWIRRFTQGRH